MFLENSQNLQENTCQVTWVGSFFKKVAGWSLQLYLKKRLWHRCFPVNFAKFLRTPFSQNTSEQMLLIIWKTNKSCLEARLNFLLVARCLLLFARCSLLLLVVRYFLLLARYFLLVTRYFFPTFMGNCPTIRHTCYPYLPSRWVLCIFVPGATQGNEDAEWVQDFILLFLCFV